MRRSLTIGGNRWRVEFDKESDIVRLAEVEGHDIVISIFLNEQDFLDLIDTVSQVYDLLIRERPEQNIVNEAWSTGGW